MARRKSFKADSSKKWTGRSYKKGEEQISSLRDKDASQADARDRIRGHKYSPTCWCQYCEYEKREESSKQQTDESLEKESMILVSIGQLKRMISEAMHVSDPSVVMESSSEDDEDELDEDDELRNIRKSPVTGKSAPPPPSRSNIRKSPVTGRTAPKPPRPRQMGEVDEALSDSATRAKRRRQRAGYVPHD